MKTGLVLEGGAMRGMFTAGVLDVFMENNLKFDGAIGVSAGAVFGCNIKSHQIGRAIRYNKNYCRDRRYVSFLHWLRTGDLYPVDFCYKTLPFELDIFDQKTYADNPMDFYVTVTDANTGKPHYVICNSGDAKDIQWMRASASMPIFANVVPIDGGEYSDGGTSDSVPLKYFEELGYDRIVVVMTQPKGYRKKPYKGLPVIKLLLKKHPKLYEAMRDRHIMYNATMDYIDKCEEEGRILVIRPTLKLQVKPAEKNPDELERVYQNGVSEGRKYVDDVRRFVEK
ncbi:MAG: patatin family protein [Lachnospiraceae bacterium]|nr:patatin family protein [Lachnospiraceae bacterium]